LIECVRHLSDNGDAPKQTMPIIDCGQIKLLVHDSFAIHDNNTMLACLLMSIVNDDDTMLAGQ